MESSVNPWSSVNPMKGDVSAADVQDFEEVACATSWRTSQLKADLLLASRKDSDEAHQMATAAKEAERARQEEAEVAVRAQAQAAAERAREVEAAAQAAAAERARQEPTAQAQAAAKAEGC